MYTQSILGDPGADKGGKGKSKRVEKYIWNEESKERREEPLGTMSYQTSSKRSPPFWLLIGARKIQVLGLGLRGCTQSRWPPVALVLDDITLRFFSKQRPIFPGIPLLRGNGTAKRATKMSTCFSTVLQNELKSDVARFTTHVLATDQVVASYVNTDF